MSFGSLQGQLTLLQPTPDTQGVAVLPPGPPSQVFQGCLAAHVRGETGIRLLPRRLGVAQHLVKIDVALRMAGCEELLYSARGGLRKARRGGRSGPACWIRAWPAPRREEFARN